MRVIDMHTHIFPRQVARKATAAGADMIIANGRDVGILHELLEGAGKGTLFLANPEESFRLEDFLE